MIVKKNCWSHFFFVKLSCLQNLNADVTTGYISKKKQKKKRKPTSPRVTIHIERAYTYRRLFLPHFNIFSLCLGEVIPNFLVTGCSKYPFDLTDCWWTQELHVAYKNTTNPRCIPDLIASHTIACTHQYNSFVLSFVILAFIHSLVYITLHCQKHSHMVTSIFIVNTILCKIFTNKSPNYFELFYIADPLL